MITSNRIAATLLCLAAWTPFSVGAQPHESRDGGYTLRSSTVASTSLPMSMAQAHGFEQKPSVFVLNVTVIEDVGAGNGTVPATLAVRIRDLAGREVPVDMTLDRENGYVSYYGTYRRRPHQVLSFAIRATPQGTDRTLTLRYRDP